MKNSRQPRRTKRVVAAGVVALMCLIGATALTAANTVPDTKAGDGGSDVTGYIISDITYLLDALDPGLVDTVNFTLDTAIANPLTATIQIQLGTTWVDCSAVGTAVTCDVNPLNVLADEVPVTAVANLRVVIVD